MTDKADNMIVARALSGSRLYGTNRPDSDHDIVTILLPSVDEVILGKDGATQTIGETIDSKTFYLRYYFELLLKMDPSAVESLLSTGSNVISTSPIWERVVANKNLFLSNRIYRRITGYSYSEWRKAFGVKLQIEDRTKTEDDVIAMIRDVCHPEKDDMDDIIEKLCKNKKRVLVPSTRDFGAKRKAELEKYGFGVSNAAHTIRLLGELAELMLTGNISFPRPNCSILRDIRQGKVSKDEVVKIHDEEEKKAILARDHSVLPDQPDFEKAWELYCDIVRSELKKSL